VSARPALFCSPWARQQRALCLRGSPPCLRRPRSALRGYTGDLTPAKVLDVLATTDSCLVDLRTAAQMEAKGVPGLPKASAAKLVRVEFDTIAVRLAAALPALGIATTCAAA